MCVGDGGQDDQDDIITTTITKVIITTITREVLRTTFKSKWVGGTDYTITIMGGTTKPATIRGLNRELVQLALSGAGLPDPKTKQLVPSIDSNGISNLQSSDS